MEEALREAAGSSYLGTRREVAVWVKAGFGDELDERRKAVKSALEVRLPSADAVISSSGLRTMPSVGSFTPSGMGQSGMNHAASLTPTPHSAANQSITSPSQAPTAVHPHSERKKGRGFLIALGGAVLFCAAVGAVVIVKAITAQPVEEAAKPEPPKIAAPVAPPAPSPPAAAPTEKPCRPRPRRRSSKARRRARARRGAPSPPRPEARARRKTSRRPRFQRKSAAEPPKNSARWDKDSPLLHRSEINEMTRRTNRQFLVCAALLSAAASAQRRAIPRASPDKATRRRRARQERSGRL
jgi:hypothetical protein